MSQEPSVVHDEYSFGPFRLIPRKQLLLEGGEPVKLGARALDLLRVLVERPGELVSKQELIASVWPDTCVEESNLKVQIATLRRALKEDRAGRYVATTNGRGYRFVAPVARARSEAPIAPSGEHNLAPNWTPPLGRGEVVEALRAELPESRFITIVGPGGIGKTTVALALAHALVGTYADGVWFVELAALRDPGLVPSMIAAALGPGIRPRGRVADLPVSLRDRQMLIVLDCCEHVLGAAASIAEDLVWQAPRLHVVATSREPLRAAGEVVRRLGPLAIPPADAELAVSEALRYPAVQLFVQRAATVQQRFTLTAANAATIAEICRRLDGIALAIELAARRTDAFGVSELLSLLAHRFELLTHGRRTDPPRHQTLAAAIDWSYDLLLDTERAILRRLAIFSGPFVLESALAVAAPAVGSEPDVAAQIGNLVAKSLVSAEIGNSSVRYRLLDSTRAYARQKLERGGELPALARRHAEHYCALLQRAETEWQSRPPGEWLADYGHCIDDVRSALDWAFSEEGDPALGAALAAASVPLWTQLSLVDECRRRMEQALGAAWDRTGGAHVEMRLSAGLGTSLLQTRGPTATGEAAWRKAAEIAEQLGEHAYRLHALWGLCDYHTWRGEHRSALEFAHRIRAVAIEAGDRDAQVNVGRQAGTALRYLGEFDAARQELERMIGDYVQPAHWTQSMRFELDPRIAARGTLSNVLWLQGFPERAVALSRQALADAKTANHPLALCNAYAHTAIPIALFVDDLRQAEQWLSEFLEHSAKHSMPVWEAIGRCLQGILLIQRRSSAGLMLLRGGLDDLGKAGFRMRYPAYLGSLADGLLTFGRIDDARQTIDEALNWSTRHEELWCRGELLRIKGEVLRVGGLEDEAELFFRQALTWSTQRRARSLELRAVASLAGLWRHKGRSDQADRLFSGTDRRCLGGNSARAQHATAQGVLA